MGNNLLGEKRSLIMDNVMEVKRKKKGKEIA